MILRDSKYRGNASFAQILELAEAALADDAQGRRGEFVALVKKAQQLSGKK